MRSPGTGWIGPLTDFATVGPVVRQLGDSGNTIGLHQVLAPSGSAEFEGCADPAVAVHLEAEGHRAGAVAVPDVRADLGDLGRGRGDVDRTDCAALLRTASRGRR